MTTILIVLMDLDGLEWLGSCSGPSQFNLLNYLMKVEGLDTGNLESAVNISKSLDYHCRFVHENSHWARFNGTSIGGTLGLMRYAQQRTVEVQFKNLSSRERAVLTDQRKAGRPIINLDDQAAQHRSEAFQLFRQFWLDLQIGYKLLFDSSTLDDQKLDPEASLQSALTDCFIFMTGSYDPSLPMISPAAREETTIRWDGGVRAVALGDRRVTTRSLFECAATIDQLFALPYLDIADLHSYYPGAIGQILTTFNEVAYGEPVHAYAYLHRRHSGGAQRDIFDHLTTVLALIDFALNPPLPPAINTPETIRQRKWWELYPPKRFIHACQAVAEIGTLETDCSNEDLRNYISRLARVLGTIDPYTYTGPMCATDAPLAEYPSMATLCGADYICFLASVQRRLWRLRLDDPLAIVLYGQVPTLRSRDRAEFLTIGGTGWYHAPFQWTENDACSWTTPPGRESSLQYFGSVAAHVMLNEAMTQIGDMRVDRFPRNRLPNGFWGEVRRLTEELLHSNLWP